MTFGKYSGHNGGRFNKSYDRYDNDDRYSGNRYGNGRRDDDDDRGHGRDKYSKHDDDRGYGHGRDKPWKDRDDNDDAPEAGNLQTENFVSWTLDAKGVTIDVTAMLDDKGNVVFSYELNEGRADLTGFYLDLNNDGGKITSVGCGDDMRGRDAEGHRLDGFDFAQKIGKPGGRDGQTTEGQVVVSLEELGVSSLEELAGAELGIRATSVGKCGSDSLKLAETGTYTETTPGPDLPGGEIILNFPNNEAGPTTLTLVYGAHYSEELGDWQQPYGDQNEDWLYSIQLKTDVALPTDLDSYIEILLEDLRAVDANVTDHSLLKGVFIEAPGAATDFYYYSVYNANGEESDNIPGDFTIDPETGEVLSPELIDVSYDLSATGDQFLFA